MNTLRDIRRQRGLTLRELGRMTGISYPYLSEVERDMKGGRISLIHARRLADALGVALSDIWPNDTADPRSEPPLGPLGVLTVDERVRFAQAILTGTGYDIGPAPCDEAS